MAWSPAGSTNLSIYEPSPCTIRTQQRYMHLPATRKDIAGVLFMRIPKQPKQPSVETRLLLGRHVVEVRSSCSQLRTVVAVTTRSCSKFREVRESSEAFCHHFLALSWFAQQRERQRADDTCLIDRLSRPSLNSFFFLEVRQCCGCSCNARLKRSSYTLVTSFCYSICSASLREARL